MKISARAVILSIAAACCALPLHAGQPWTRSRPSADARPSAAAPGPPACSLNPEDLKARRDELLPGLFDRAESVTEIAHGIRLRFDLEPGLLTDIAELMEKEQACCSFLRFRLMTTEGGGPVSLEVRGPRGTTKLLRMLQST